MSRDWAQLISLKENEDVMEALAEMPPAAELHSGRACPVV